MYGRRSTLDLVRTRDMYVVFIQRLEAEKPTPAPVQREPPLLHDVILLIGVHL